MSLFQPSFFIHVEHSITFKREALCTLYSACQRLCVLCMWQYILHLLCLLILSSFCCCLQTFHNKSPVQTEGFCPLKCYIIRIRWGCSRNLAQLWRNFSLSHSHPYHAILSDFNFLSCLLSRTLHLLLYLLCYLSCLWIPLCFCALLHTTAKRWTTQKFEVSKTILFWLILQPCMLHYRIIYTINISNHWFLCVPSTHDQSISFFHTYTHQNVLII